VTAVGLMAVISEVCPVVDFSNNLAVVVMLVYTINVVYPVNL
jgi:hypothetical protein